MAGGGRKYFLVLSQNFFVPSARAMCYGVVTEPGEQMSPDDPRTHLRIRIEPKLLERLEREQKRHRRTLTGEIIERLENSFRQDDISYAVSSVESEVSSVADEVDSMYRALDRELKLLREELHQIRTELQELRRSVGAPPSTFLSIIPPKLDEGEDK